MADCCTRTTSRDLSDFDSGIDRAPEEPQSIVAERTKIIKHDPTNAQADFRRGHAEANLHGYAQAQHDLDRASESLATPWPLTTGVSRPWAAAMRQPP